MKRFLKNLGLVLAILMFITAIPTLAESDKVEISFCVGDETLMINGEAVQVEKPYVVGAGVTLVPLRVITEAFGATVEWVAETKTINLSYPDVAIVLQIDNPIAEVNGKAETLLSAPELTPNGFTMVPLRFISETFGADVSYDEATRQITVVKETVGNDGTVVGSIEEGKIGDSFYGWSMETPADMMMEERSFDGTYTVFSYDDNNWFTLTITLTAEDYDFERDFAEFKSSLQGFTLVKADKNKTNADCNIMHFQAKDKDVYMDIRQYVTKTYTFALYGEFENEKAEVRDEGLRLLSTFACTFPTEDVHDLSVVKDGMRTYTSETMGFSMQIPQDFVLGSSEAVENEMHFYKLDEADMESMISIGIYSKSETGTAEELANEDFERNRALLNPKLATYSENVKTAKYANIEAYEYTEEQNTSGYTLVRRDVFFELGDYVYNVAVSLKNPDSTAQSTMDKILNSITISEIDKEEVGILMRNVPDYEGTFTYKGDGYTLQVPNSFMEVADMTLLGMQSGAVVSFAKSKEDVSYSDLRMMMENQESEAKKQGYEITKTTKQTALGDVKYADMTLKQEEDGETIYVRQLAGTHSGEVFAFIILYPELTYSESVIAQTEAIVKSMKID